MHDPAPALGPILAFALAVSVQLFAIVAVRHGPERLWPAHLRRTERHGVTLAAWGALFLGQAFAGPALGAAVTGAVNAAGGGLIRLPERGLGWWAGLAAYFLAMDFAEWAFHRAQHAIPALWAMHSLHHSDRAYDSTTAGRHFWLEPAIKTLSVWLVVGVLLRTPGSVLAIYALASFWHFVVHSDTRLDLGRWSWVLNAPGYHRLHHSRAEEHFDVNFASLFPIFDVLARCYRPLQPGEVVLTGLDTGEEPLDALDVVAWPLRRWRPARRTPALA